MSKFVAKNTAPIDVLVVGDHPSAYLAAMLLKQKSDLRVVLALPAADRANPHADDRLVTINPALFDLHPLITGLKAKLNLTNIFGLHFLSDQAETASEHRTKSTVTCVARYSDVRDAMARLFESQHIEMIAAAPLSIQPSNSLSSSILQIDEHGLTVQIGKHTLNARALVLSEHAIGDEKKLLGLPASWEAEVMHRFTLARCKSGRHLNLSARTLMPMSLDLQGKLCWGWLLPGDGEFQLVVDQPLSQATTGSGAELLAHWVNVLKLHKILGPDFSVSTSAIQTSDRPLAGALAHEGVANRTLLIGPAGGFYSACGEEMYPSCWSALFAADVLKKALKEKHLQDALNPYRHKWRTTLGDYLRGPHQNLRFLLPLVYRNPAMTARIAEAILLSKSVVR